MKLYLSSYRIPVPEKLFELIGKPPQETRVAIIPNAKDSYIERIWNMKVQEVVGYFGDLGFMKSDVVDLRQYSEAAALKDVLSKYDLVWVTGGNTFLLRDAMKQSGFDKIVRDLLDMGIVYGGESAGELVTGSTLRGIETADSPEFAEEIIWDGLGLVDEFIFPHADDSAYAEALKSAHEIHNEVIELKNSQAIVIDNEKREVAEKRV